MTRAALRVSAVGQAAALAAVLAVASIAQSEVGAQPQAPRTATAVWIDTDPAVGVTDRDVDDGIALWQAFASPELAVRGVSIVFGNAALAQAWPIGRRLVRELGPAGLRVYRGAAAASDLGRETSASRALAAALVREPLVVIALGPATNVATVLQRHPELGARIVRLVAVAGRRPGQRFTTGTVNRSGHRDFNFEEDPDAFRVVLASHVPLTLAPFEISSAVWITASDLDRMAQGPPRSHWIVKAGREWLRLWERTFGVDGFNPFDTLAIARITSPALLTCDIRPARIEDLPDDVTEPRMQGTSVATKPYLLVSRDGQPPAPVAEYCYATTPAFKNDLLTRLMR